MAIKKFKKKIYNNNINFLKTLFASLIIIFTFSVLPSLISFIKGNLVSNEVVFNSSKQNFDEMFEKQNNEEINNRIKDRFSWNIFEDIDVFG